MHYSPLRSKYSCAQSIIEVQQERVHQDEQCENSAKMHTYQGKTLVEPVVNAADRLTKDIIADCTNLSETVKEPLTLG